MPCAVQRFADLHTYQFCPGDASVFTKVSPAWQAAGNCVPVFDGKVELADEKSTLLPCVRKSTRVCASPVPASVAAASEHMTTVCSFMMVSSQRCAWLTGRHLPATC